MRKYILPVILIGLIGVFPFRIHALAFQHQIAELVSSTHERLILNPNLPVTGWTGQFQFPMTGGRVSASVILPSPGAQRMSPMRFMKLKRRYIRRRPEISDQNRHERAAAAWGGASLFSAIVFISAGLLASSLLVYAFCLLAIPFGILAIIRQRKARALGSKRNEGTVMGIVGMSIVGLGLTFLALLAIAFAIY